MKRFTLIAIAIVIVIAGAFFIIVPAARGDNFPRNLSYGSRGESVRQLQQFLRGAGFYAGPITGNFFSLTRASVRRFQKTFSIPSTGFFGPLSRELAERMSAPSSIITPLGNVPAPLTPAPVTPPQAEISPRPNIATERTPLSGCMQMDAGNNNLSERRVNLIFVGANYASVNDFEEVVKLAADPDARANGFFSVEPFKSNRNKFNILYATTIPSIGQGTSTLPISDEARSLFRGALGACNYDNRFGFVLINTSKNLLAQNIGEVSGIANAIPPEQGFISVFPYPAPDSNALRRAQGLVLHEGGGHAIGSLFDEYVTATWTPNPATINETYPAFQNQCYVLEPSSLRCERLSFGPYLCNFGANPQAEQTCTVNSAWRDLIGNGCGRDGVIDCTERDPNYQREIRCWEARCSVNSFGSVGAGIMESEFDIRNFYFGAQNERLICRRIRDITGLAGGVCNSLCLSGCPVGQFCSAGACRARQ
ncbi:peptidoglycan-binding protein [Candidatus Wolfebacteria bacterium]|nr:peptidoglycan-binding protein [Candidatus Wolfebacteria bacterium]